MSKRSYPGWKAWYLKNSTRCIIKALSVGWRMVNFSRPQLSPVLPLDFLCMFSKWINPRRELMQGLLLQSHVPRLLKVQFKIQKPSYLHPQVVSSRPPKGSARLFRSVEITLSQGEATLRLDHRTCKVSKSLRSGSLGWEALSRTSGVVL